MTFPVAPLETAVQVAHFIIASGSLHLHRVRLGAQFRWSLVQSDVTQQKVACNDPARCFCVPAIDRRFSPYGARRDV